MISCLSIRFFVIYLLNDQICKKGSGIGKSFQDRSTIEYMFVHLTSHSAYSLQEGLPLPSELAQAAQSEGMPTLGLTDHRLLTGSVEFVIACRKAGIQPLLGLDIDLDTGPLSLLAMNTQGWSALCRISSVLAMQDDPETPCTLDILSSYSNDLIALSGDQGDPYGRKLGELRELFSDRLYLTLQDPGQGVTLSALGRQLSIPLVVTHPIYYLEPEQAALQRTLTAIRMNQPLVRIPPHANAKRGSHFIGVKDMEQRFWNFPVALAATEEIAKRCSFELPLGVAHMPTVATPDGMTVSEFLRLKAEEGARRIYGRLDATVRQRLDHELEVIAHMGYEPIFLIVEEILDFARSNNVPFSSRGSAASSLVAHCLGITSPDPLRLDLYFERFLNPARTTPPDIDTDLCSRRRDIVLQHVFDTYGPERAAMVGTINRFRPRSALGDVAKAFDIPPHTIREMVDQLPYAFSARNQDADEDNEKSVPSPFADLRSRYRSSPFPLIFDQAEALLKLPRHLSVHAGGMVLAPGLLTDIVPVMRSGSKGVTITQLDLDAVEELGLVKIDLLGIRGLTVQGDVAEFIQVNNQQQYPTPLSVLESIPSDDPPTSQRLETGMTIGCFQIESPGMRATLKEIRARCEDDLIAALALYRPGPLTGGLKDAFVRRFKGEEPVTHIHPAMAPLLKDTYGVILYQEQVLRIAHDLAGFSLAEADLLRRAMSHFDPGKRMKLLQEKFIAEVEARNGIPKEIGERVWEMMAAFAGYGFPKAHAASYAKVSWRSAWCKTHFPAEFMAAVLANWGGYYSQRVYLSEARRMGLRVHAPHVNYSVRNFCVAEKKPGNRELFMGLDQVPDLTQRTMERIIRMRPYRSVEDFLAKVDPRRQEAENLVQVGGLDGFSTIPVLLDRVKRGSWQVGQPGLFEWQESCGEDWTVAQKVAAQQALLGISLDAHPLDMVADRIRAAGAISTIEAAGEVGEKVTVAGVRQSGHRSRTAKGEAMMFLTLEDLSGMLDVVLFPDAYRQARSFIHGSEPILVTGVVEMDVTRGEPLLRAERVEKVN
jgi:DNA-directed DNA polymerase III PolC